MNLKDILFNAGKKGKEAKENIDLIKDIKELVDFMVKNDAMSAVDAAKLILGDFVDAYEFVSSKDFMEPVKNLIIDLQKKNYAEYKETRDKLCSKDRKCAEDRMWQTFDSETLNQFDKLYQIEQRVEELRKEKGLSTEIDGVKFDASLQNNPKPTAQISKKPSIAILANLDKLPPQELLAELHRLENLPTKNDFSREIMAKIETQLEKFNQTENPNLEIGIKA